MSELDLINLYFNIIDLNEPAIVRGVTKSYQSNQQFVEWLNQRGLEFSSLLLINDDIISTLKANSSLDDIASKIESPFKEECATFSRHYKSQMHVVYIGNGEQVIDQEKCRLIHPYFYSIEYQKEASSFSFFDPFASFIGALTHIEMWPGVLIFNDQHHSFVSINSQKELEDILKSVGKGNDLFKKYSSLDNDSYYIQISDLHLGRGKRKTGLNQLRASLYQLSLYLHSPYPLKYLITGDLMESPNRKNMYLANDFMNELKKKYHADVTFVLGNHDVIVHGFNFARRQKSKVIAYLLGESIKVLEKEKVIIIKLDTTSEGNLARGKVGQRQLDEIDDELSAIENVDEYTKIAILHHHVHPLTKAQFLKLKWNEKTFIGRLIEKSKVLVDAPLLINWLEERNIQYVFHGHKHVPFFKRIHNIVYVGAGSATGGLKESKSRYISYNVMKYSMEEKKMKSCLIFYDDKAKAERQRVEVYLYEEEDNENNG